MISISFLPCNNGLGHIRRMALIANKIPKHDKNIFFFIDKTKKEKFNLNNNIKKTTLKIIPLINLTNYLKINF